MMQVQQGGIPAMKASDFESRHQTLVHQFVVAAGFLTYLLDRDDIVWRLVKSSTAPRELERTLFTIATLAIAAGAGICTWARACRETESTAGVGPNRYLWQPLFLGELFYAVGLASLAPLSGFIILVGGETLRVFRLIVRANDPAKGLKQQLHEPALAGRPLETKSNGNWQKAFRKEAAKWGIFLTMIVFVVTLVDRLAEYLAAASFLFGLLLNPPTFRSSPGADESS
jgi:hypothetical protein